MMESGIYLQKTIQRAGMCAMTNIKMKNFLLAFCWGIVSSFVFYE